MTNHYLASLFSLSGSYICYISMVYFGSFNFLFARVVYGMEGTCNLLDRLYMHPSQGGPSFYPQVLTCMPCQYMIDLLRILTLKS